VKAPDHQVENMPCGITVGSRRPDGRTPPSGDFVMIRELSNTARAVLTLAVEREGHLVQLPQLPVAAARQVVRSLLSAGLVEEIAAPTVDADFAWRDAEDGGPLMLRVTEAGLARISEVEAAKASPAADKTPPEMTVSASENDAGLEVGADDEREGGPENTETGATIRVESSIASLVSAFVLELAKPERAPFVVTFLRRLNGAGARSTETTRDRGMTPSQRKIVELCSRPEGATGKELAEGCGWPSIAARATCQILADRFGYDLHESPKANGRGISFRMTPKPVADDHV
jgi:hypothetical protein